MRLHRRICLAALLVSALARPGAAGTLEIHPAGASVPENLLRIELRFATPQPLPFDVGRLSLVDAETGRALEGALLDLALPNADGRRITVLLDPGRVKLGVGPNLDAGRALRPGHPVRLLVDGMTRGAAVAVKEWQVSDAVTNRLRPAGWRLAPPRAGTRDPLVLSFGLAISAAGEGLVAVQDAAGRRVPGHAGLREGDAVWTFTPRHPWRRQDYRLVTHPDLEDPAGNRVCAAFEEVRASQADCAEGASLTFRPGR